MICDVILQKKTGRFIARAKDYPDGLYNDCEKYRNRLSDIDELKTAVWEAAQAITHIEEKELKNFLQSVEGRLDMIQFTGENIFEDSLEIISELTEKICKIKHDISMKLNHGEIFFMDRA